MAETVAVANRCDCFLRITDACVVYAYRDTLWKKQTANDRASASATVIRSWFRCRHANTVVDCNPLARTENKWSIDGHSVTNKGAIQTRILNMREGQVLPLYHLTICDGASLHARNISGLTSLVRYRWLAWRVDRRHREQRHSACSSASRPCACAVERQIGAHRNSPLASD